jgi:hypothetical protein
VALPHSETLESARPYSDLTPSADYGKWAAAEQPVIFVYTRGAQNSGMSIKVRTVSNIGEADTLLFDSGGQVRSPGSAELNHVLEAPRLVRDDSHRRKTATSCIRGTVLDLVYNRG